MIKSAFSLQHHRGERQWHDAAYVRGREVSGERVSVPPLQNGRPEEENRGPGAHRVSQGTVREETFPIPGNLI